MHIPTDTQQAKLQQAAQMRAAGKSWETVGLELRVPSEQCQRWPTEHATLWQELYRVACERLMQEVRAEAVLVLRALLRCEDERTRRDAARELLRLAEPNLGSESADRDDVGGLLNYLGGLDDAGVDRLVRELVGLALDTTAAGGGADDLGSAAG